MWFLYIHLHAFETLDTRANNAESRADEYTKRKRVKEKAERQETSGTKMRKQYIMERGKKTFLFDKRPAVIQDERALICT